MVKQCIMIGVLLSPSLLSVLLVNIFYKVNRRDEERRNGLGLIAEYAISLLVNTYFTACIIVGYIGSNVRFEAACSVGFIIRYFVIAMGVALLEIFVRIYLQQKIHISIHLTNLDREKEEEIK